MSRGLHEIEIGDWYTTPWNAERFEVVAMDDDSVEIQYFDGTVAEIDFDSWPQFEVEESTPPEDWTGAFDADREDLDNEGLNAEGLFDINRILS